MPRVAARALEVTSSAFGHGQRIPAEHTLDGKNVSPDLEWARGVEGRRSYALICDDPDAPTNEPFTHWVLYDIPADATGLPEGGGGLGTRGLNDFGDLGYDGPAPPPGHGVHHYHLKVYALDRTLDLDPGATKADLLQAMKGHVLGKGELIGTYSR